MLAKVPSGTLANIVREVNIAKTEICCINNTFEEIEINDVLENILLLLKYITKTLKWQGILEIFDEKEASGCRCLICLILLFSFIGVPYWYGKKSEYTRVHIRGPP